MTAKHTKPNAISTTVSRTTPRGHYEPHRSEKRGSLTEPNPRTRTVKKEPSSAPMSKGDAYLEVVAAKDNADNVLADVMHVSLDG